MRFEFATATQIIFGPGTLKDIALPAAEMGHNGFVITGQNPERATPLVKQLNKQGLEFSLLAYPKNPRPIWPLRRSKKPAEMAVIS